MKENWNKPLIALVLSGVFGVWTFVVYAFIDARADLAGVIASGCMAFFYFASKRARNKEENWNLICMAHLMGALITYAAAYDFGVSRINCVVSALLMPLLFSGIVYLWYDVNQFN